VKTEDGSGGEERKKVSGMKLLEVIDQVSQKRESKKSRPVPRGGGRRSAKKLPCAKKTARRDDKIQNSEDIRVQEMAKTY